ncbi:hypothetical protein EJD97_021640 [Solanum chilense]|uniref:BZIP domain-containing protein n=1 Tax=Solanum chilense TaxID=4083 RepID=A0A6N2AUX0_SOLCI|nr:hypothetical protein EJD97_021640 [Solanum chilense]
MLLLLLQFVYPTYCSLIDWIAKYHLNSSLLNACCLPAGSISIMDDMELEFSSQEVLSSSTFGEIPESSPMNKRFNEILTDVHACIHAHTCNPPGPDNSHTHTCYHVHTKVVTPPRDDTTAESTTANVGKKRLLSNKEAVRKYCEKKKARVASLEEEVVRLRDINQQLLNRLQGQAVLEAEVSRLKCLLVDIRGRIAGEIGSFPYHKPMEGADVYQNLRGTYVMNPCNLQCDDQVYCLQPNLEESNGQGLNSCGFETLQCSSSQGLKEVSGCALGFGTPTANTSRGNKKKRTGSHLLNHIRRRLG